MPRKKLSTARQTRSHQEEGATAKRALAQALQQLGPEATSRDISKFMKKQFGIDFTFVLITPKGNRRKNVPKVSRQRAA